MPSLTRRKICQALSLLALTSASLSVSAPVLAAGTPTAKIATVVWIGYGPFYVAEKLDLFKKYGLKVELQMFSDPALIPSAIASGAVDGGMLTYDQVVGEAAKGQKQKVVMPIDYSDGGDAIVATTAIKSPADFKGKSIAFNPLSPSEFLLNYALSTKGMTEKDVTTVNMTPEGVPAAMVSGTVPVGVTYEPNVSQILAQGGGKKFHVVYSSHDAPGLIADVLVFDQKQIDAKPKQIDALIRGYLDGMAYMKQKPDDAARIIAKYLGVSPAEVKDQMSGVHNLPLDEMVKAFEKSDKTTSYYASGAVISRILVAKGQISKAPATEDTIDARFVKAVAAK